MTTILNQTYKARTVKITPLLQSNKETSVRQTRTSPIQALSVFTHSRDSDAAKPSVIKTAGNRGGHTIATGSSKQRIKAWASDHKQVWSYQKRSRQPLPRTLWFKRERDEAAKIAPWFSQRAASLVLESDKRRSSWRYRVHAPGARRVYKYGVRPHLRKPSFAENFYLLLPGFIANSKRRIPRSGRGFRKQMWSRALGSNAITSSIRPTRRPRTMPDDPINFRFHNALRLLVKSHKETQYYEAHREQVMVWWSALKKFLTQNRGMTSQTELAHAQTAYAAPNKGPLAHPGAILQQPLQGNKRSAVLRAIRFLSRWNVYQTMGASEHPVIAHATRRNRLKEVIRQWGALFAPKKTPSERELFRRILQRRIRATEEELRRRAYRIRPLRSDTFSHIGYARRHKIIKAAKRQFQALPGRVNRALSQQLWQELRARQKFVASYKRGEPHAVSAWGWSRYGRTAGAAKNSLRLHANYAAGNLGWPAARAASIRANTPLGVRTSLFSKSAYYLTKRNPAAGSRLQTHDKYAIAFFKRFSPTKFRNKSVSSVQRLRPLGELAVTRKRVTPALPVNVRQNTLSVASSRSAFFVNSSTRFLAAARGKYPRWLEIVKADLTRPSAAELELQAVKWGRLVQAADELAEDANKDCGALLAAKWRSGGWAQTVKKGTPPGMFKNWRMSPKNQMAALLARRRDTILKKYQTAREHWKRWAAWVEAAMLTCRQQFKPASDTSTARAQVLASPRVESHFVGAALFAELRGDTAMRWQLQKRLQRARVERRFLSDDTIETEVNLEPLYPQAEEQAAWRGKSIHVVNQQNLQIWNRYFQTVEAIKLTAVKSRLETRNNSETYVRKLSIASAWTAAITQHGGTPLTARQKVKSFFKATLAHAKAAYKSNFFPGAFKAYLVKKWEVARSGFLPATLSIEIGGFNQTGAVSKFSQPNFIFNRAPKYKLYWMRRALNRRAVERKLAIFKEKVFTRRPQPTESLVATNNSWRISAFVPWYEDAFETSQNLLVRWREAWGRPYLKRLQNSAIGAVKLWTIPYGFMRSNAQPREELVRWPNISSGIKIRRIAARNPRSRVGAALSFEKHWNPEHQKTIRASEEKRVTAAVRATYPLYLMPESAERTLIPDFFETIPVKWMRNAGAFHNKLVYELPQMLNCISSTLRSGALMTPAEKRTGHRFSAEPPLAKFVSNFRKTKLTSATSTFQAKISRVAFNAKYSRWLAALGGDVKRNSIRKRFQRVFWDNWGTRAVEKTTVKWLPWFKQHKYSVAAREWLFGFLSNPIYFRREEGVEPDTFSQYPRRAHFTRWPLRTSFKQLEHALMFTTRLQCLNQKKAAQKTIAAQPKPARQAQPTSQHPNALHKGTQINKSPFKMGINGITSPGVSAKLTAGATILARAISTRANTTQSVPVGHLYSRKNITRTAVETDFTEFGRFCPTFEKEQPWLGRLALETGQADTQRKHHRTLLRRNMYLCSRLFPTVFAKALVRQQQIKTIAPHAQGIATQTRTAFWSLRFSLSEKTARIRWYTRRVWPAWRRATYRKTDAIRSFRNWDAKFLRPSAMQEKIFRRCFRPYLLFPRYRNRPGIGFWFRFVMPRLYDFWTENPALFNELGLPKTHLVRVRTRSSPVHHWDTQARFGGCEHMLRTLLLTKSGFPRLEKYLHTRVHVGLDVLGDRQKFLVHLPVFEGSVTPHPLHLADDQNQYVREKIAYRTPEERAARKPRPLIQLRVPSLMAQMFKRREYFSTLTASESWVDDLQFIKTVPRTGPLLPKVMQAIIETIRVPPGSPLEFPVQQPPLIVDQLNRETISHEQFLHEVIKANPDILYWTQQKLVPNRAESRVNAVQPSELADAAVNLPAADRRLVEQLLRVIFNVNPSITQDAFTKIDENVHAESLPIVLQLLAIIHEIDKKAADVNAPDNWHTPDLLAWGKQHFTSRTKPWFRATWAQQAVSTKLRRAFLSEQQQVDEASVRKYATCLAIKPQDENFNAYVTSYLSEKQETRWRTTNLLGKTFEDKYFITHMTYLSEEREARWEIIDLLGKTFEDKYFITHMTRLSENQEAHWKTIIFPGRAPKNGPMPVTGTKTWEISTQQHFLVQNAPYRGRAMEIWRPFVPARFDRYRPWLWERITTQHWKKGRVMRHFFSRAERFSRRRYWTNIPYSYYYAKRSRLRPLIWREWDTTFDNDDLYRGFSFNRAERRRARWLEVLMYRRALYSSNRRPYRRYNFPKGYASLRWLQKYRKAAANGLRSRRYLRRRRWRMVQTCNRKMFLKMFHFPHIRAAQKHFCKTSKKAPKAGQSGFGRMTRGLVSRVDVNLLILNIVGTVFWARALVFCGFLWLDNVLATTGGAQLLPGMRLGFEWGTIDHFSVYFKKVQWSYKKFPQLLTPCTRLANLPKHFKASHRTHVVVYNRAPRYGDITLRSRFNAIMFCLFQVSAGQGH